MKTLSIIILLSLVVFGCQKELNPENVVASLPTLTTTAATSITNTTVSSGGNISDDGGAAITVRGVCWDTTHNPIATGNHTTDGTGAGSFASNITGLTAMTVYYVRAYATNSVGTAYGNEISFTSTNTSTALPTVTTASTTAITLTTATSGGNVVTDGGATVTARGVCWSITTNPVASGNHTTDGTGTGIFASAISGLTAATIYHVRAYATNSVGTAYGGDSTFTTASTTTIPVITTTAATVITFATATSGGTISSDGGAAVTARGICWSTTANPSIALPTKTTDGTGIGTFTSAITGLTASTLYHVRAYATNSVGTAYGNDITFTTTTLADMYVSGNQASGTNEDAKFWKNGVPTTIGVGNPYMFTNDIFVSGTDVYIVGNQFVSNGVNSTWSVMLWKNGVPTVLMTSLNNAADATSVFVSGTDVYVAGYVFTTGGGGIAKFWKNGVATDLTSGALLSKALSIYVSGTDVYVAGVESVPVIGGIAKYWKNGVATSLSTGFGEAEGIFVSGNDVYVCGYEQSPTGYSAATLWKNGVATHLTTGLPREGYAHDVFVSGNDVYVAGEEFNSTTPSTSVAKTWKNGVVTNLTNGTTAANAQAIMVKGSDVYVAGSEYVSSTYVAMVWVNGVAMPLTTLADRALATGISVK